MLFYSFFNATAPSEIYTLSLHDALPILSLEYAPLLADIYWTRVVQYYGNKHVRGQANLELLWPLLDITTTLDPNLRSEEHTSELQSHHDLVCRLLLEKKKTHTP